MSGVDDLVAWLGAQLKEDERVARAQDEHLSGHDRPLDLADPTDPARVLADVAAKRKILDQFWDTSATFKHFLADEDAGMPKLIALRAKQVALLDVLRALAEPYAGRPGWRPEWRTG